MAITSQKGSARSATLGKKKVSRAKARIILKEGKIRGRKLTRKQRGFFGIIASGKRLTRVKSKRHTKRPRRK